MVAAGDRWGPMIRSPTEGGGFSCTTCLELYNNTCREMFKTLWAPGSAGSPRYASTPSTCTACDKRFGVCVRMHVGRHVEMEQNNNVALIYVHAYAHPEFGSPTI